MAAHYTSSNSLTEDGLRSQIARLEQLADDGGDHYQRVCRILAQNYQLAGSLARDRFQYTKSIEYFQKAEQLHDDIQLPDLTATAIARQAVALLRKDQERYIKKSLALYSSAVDKAKHAEPYTQAYVLSGYAESSGTKLAYYLMVALSLWISGRDVIEHCGVKGIPIEEDFAQVRLHTRNLSQFLSRRMLCTTWKT